jgi:cell division protein FtsL
MSGASMSRGELILYITLMAIFLIAVIMLLIFLGQMIQLLNKCLDQPATCFQTPPNITPYNMTR